MTSASPLEIEVNFLVSFSGKDKKYEQSDFLGETETIRRKGLEEKLKNLRAKVVSDIAKAEYDYYTTSNNMRDLKIYEEGDKAVVEVDGEVVLQSKKGNRGKLEHFFERIGYQKGENNTYSFNSNSSNEVDIRIKRREGKVKFNIKYDEERTENPRTKACMDEEIKLDSFKKSNLRKIGFKHKKTKRKLEKRVYRFTIDEVDYKVQIHRRKIGRDNFFLGEIEINPDISKFREYKGGKVSENYRRMSNRLMSEDKIQEYSNTLRDILTNYLGIPESNILNVSTSDLVKRK